MTKLLFSIIVLISLTLTGCGTRELVKYSDEECGTTLEGYYFKQKTTEYYPAVFLKTDKDPKLIKGEILAVDSSGIKQDPASGGIYSEGEVLYPYDTLFGAVNEFGRIIYGDIPDRFSAKQSLEITLEELATGDKTLLKLLPNEPFSYCIKPGQYGITDIVFVESKSVKDIGVDFPRIIFTIEKDKANYAGNIFVDFKTSRDNNVIVIPYSRVDRNGAMAAGMIGGLVGATIYALASAAADDGKNHIINIETDKNFLPESNKEVKTLEMNISKESY